MRLNEELRALAARQHGLLTSTQMRTSGMASAAISRRRASGALERLEPRVYRIPGAPPTREQRLMQALLGAGPGAALSHGTAARLHELDGFADYEQVELTIARGRRYRRVRAHETSDLPRNEVTTIRGLVVTRPIRTLKDIATVFPSGVVEQAYESAMRRGLVVDRAVRASLRAGDPGVKVLRSVLDRRAGLPPTESVLETRFAQLVRRARLPRPARQVRVGPHRVDFAWPELRVAVELDGRHHDGHDARRRDIRRQNAIAVETGWRLLRYTWEDVVEQPDTVVASIRAALGAAMRH